MSIAPVTAATRFRQGLAGGVLLGAVAVAAVHWALGGAAPGRDPGLPAPTPARDVFADGAAGSPSLAGPLLD